MPFKSFSCILITLSLCSVFVFAGWTGKEMPESVLSGVTFGDATTGYICGGNNGVGAEILKSTDGGKTFQRIPTSNTTLMFMAIAASTPTDAVASGLGILLDANQYTLDGKEFKDSEEAIGITECQSADKVTGNNQYFGLTGQFANHDGLAFTRDGGKTYTNYKYNQTTPSRYGAFPAPDIWYIAGGQWPENNSDATGRIHQHNKYLHIDTKEYVTKFIPGGENTEQDDNGFLGVIQKTTDGGKTFTNVFTDKGRFYFNQINCPTTEMCYAVSEGDSTANFGAWIWKTTDGGQHWEQQLFISKGSLFAVEFVSETEGFAGGIHLDTGKTILLHTTDGGKTWPSDVDATGAYINDFSFVGSTVGYASAFTNEGISVLFTYSA